MADIYVNCGKPTGQILPVNGFCNGPSKFTAKYFKKAQIPYSRLHDMRTHFHDICDVPAIFTDFDADENDPANYDFTLSDYYIEKILECGTGIIYRLGRSMNTGDFRWDNAPPKDYLKWARICEHIIMHYNLGWANGHSYGIEYFEIWNEPDSLNPNREMDGQWSGTAEQFYDFYAVAAGYLKKRFPEYRFGGYASCNIVSDGRREFFDGFLGYQSKAGTPIDFISWHCYADKTSAIDDRAEFVREELKKHGYEGTPQICTEWNYFWVRPGLWSEFDKNDGEYMLQELFNEASGIRGAAYSLAAMTTFQRQDIKIATLHRADALSMYCTAFNIYGVPQRQYDALLAWNELRRLGTGVEAVCDEHGVYTCAATDGESLCVTAALYSGAQGYRRLNITGLDESVKYKVTRLVSDEKAALSERETTVGFPKDLRPGFYAEAPSITVFLITPDYK